MPLYMYPPISPLLPPQLTSLFLPSPYRLHRNGSALLEAEANSLLSFKKKIYSKEKMTSNLKGHTHTHTDDVSRWYTFKTGTDGKYCFKIHLIQEESPQGRV